MQDSLCVRYLKKGIKTKISQTISLLLPRWRIHFFLKFLLLIRLYLQIFMILA